MNQEQFDARMKELRQRVASRPRKSSPYTLETMQSDFPDRKWSETRLPGTDGRSVFVTLMGDSSSEAGVSFDAQEHTIRGWIWSGELICIRLVEDSNFKRAMRLTLDEVMAMVRWEMRQ